MVRAGEFDLALATDSERTLIQALVSLVGAAGIALLVPIAILAVGTPVALPCVGCSKSRSGSLR